MKRKGKERKRKEKPKFVIGRNEKMKSIGAKRIAVKLSRGSAFNHF